MLLKHQRDPLLSLDDQLKALKEFFEPVAEEEETPRLLREALGGVLAQNVYALDTVPALGRALASGYMLKGEGETYHVISLAEALGKGAAAQQDEEENTAADGDKTPLAVRIAKDNFIADGFDVFVTDDEVRVDGQTLTLLHKGKPSGDFFRKKGGDFFAGDAAAARGDYLRSYDVARLAAAGVGQVLLYAPLKAVVLTVSRSMGDLGSPLTDKRYVFDHKRPFLLALLSQYFGIAATDLGISPLKKDLLSPILENLSHDYDLILCTIDGEDADDMRGILEGFGMQFNHLNLFPGRHFSFCQIRKKPFLLLEEGGAGFWAQFHFLLSPFIAHLGGQNRRDPLHRCGVVKARFSYEKEDRKDLCLLPVTLDQEDETSPIPSAVLCEPTPFLEGEHLLKAHGFIVVPPGKESLLQDELAGFIPLFGNKEPA